LELARETFYWSFISGEGWNGRYPPLLQSASSFEESEILINDYYSLNRMPYDRTLLRGPYRTMLRFFKLFKK
jgi:hypothetical protein